MILIFFVKKNKETEGVIVIADMSGFTKLSEKLGKGEFSSGSSSSAGHGGGGASSKLSGATATAKLLRLSKNEQASFGCEKMRRILNEYFGALIDLIEAGGGDVIRVAGDAIIAQFVAPPNKNVEMGELCTKAIEASTACIGVSCYIYTYIH